MAQEEDIRELLLTLTPSARDALRRVPIRHQDDRDPVPSQLLRYSDGHGDDWADIMTPEGPSSSGPLNRQRSGPLFTRRG
jgi:hypothetical protein